MNRATAGLEPVARERPTLIRRWHWGIAAFISAAGLVYGSLLPFQFRGLSALQTLREFQRLWGEVAPAGYSSQDVAINVLITVPLSFSLMGAMLLHRRRTLNLIGGTVVTLAICFALSLVVEFAQVAIVARVSSLRDIAAQITGAAVGGILWLAFGPELSQKLDEFLKSREPASRVVWLLNAYVIALIVWSLLPFDLLTSLDEIGRKYQRGRIEIIPFTYPFSTPLKFWHAVVTQAVIFVPVGIWSTIVWIRRRSGLRNPWSAFVFGILLNAAVEMTQLFIKSRYTSSTDLLTGAAGCGTGIFAARIWARRRGQMPAADRVSLFNAAGFWVFVSIVYSALLVVVEWAPFDFTNDKSLIQRRLRRFADIPFLSLQASRSDVSAMFLIIRNFGWYVPLGFLAALAVYRTPCPRWRWGAVLVAVVSVAAVAVLGELGQILLPAKVADLTEALIRTAGGLSGLGLAMVILNRWSPRSAGPRLRPVDLRSDR